MTPGFKVWHKRLKRYVKIHSFIFGKDGYVEFITYGKGYKVESIENFKIELVESEEVE